MVSLRDSHGTSDLNQNALVCESVPRQLLHSHLTQKKKQKHKEVGTYLVSSMLSEEASPELVLELAAGMRSTA